MIRFNPARMTVSVTLGALSDDTAYEDMITHAIEVREAAEFTHDLVERLAVYSDYSDCSDSSYGF